MDRPNKSSAPSMGRGGGGGGVGFVSVVGVFEAGCCFSIRDGVVEAPPTLVPPFGLLTLFTLPTPHS